MRKGGPCQTANSGNNLAGMGLAELEAVRLTSSSFSARARWATCSEERTLSSAKRCTVRYFWSGVYLCFASDLTLDTYGGRLFHEVPRKADSVPDYYFTTPSHTNFIHP